MKSYKVAICLEEGQTVNVLANNPEEAEKKAYLIAEMYGGTNYPKEHKPDCVHRDYFVQDPQELV
jgi:hypothetical protein